MWVSGRQEIGTCFTDFFQNLFTSSSPSFLDDIASLISLVITEEENVAYALFLVL